ncbi:hypothetical protein BDN71DRAFT_991949 [Pleurotus eryngii]|uniref:Uncharacterized protein n=1 Tax=Pleurotus eryngii TaxID=5323 RepID=A0A9P5ZVK2_PLEER|nr:hypothetical protein BDN71DRAFT_991949 [Pleurotus eryngii]
MMCLATRLSPSPLRKQLHDDVDVAFIISLSGPRRPHTRLPITTSPTHFRWSLISPPLTRPHSRVHYPRTYHTIAPRLFQHITVFHVREYHYVYDKIIYNTIIAFENSAAAFLVLRIGPRVLIVVLCASKYRGLFFVFWPFLFWVCCIDRCLVIKMDKDSKRFFAYIRQHSYYMRCTQ